jgi:hypothetical protein
MGKQRKGFGYVLTQGQIETYRSWSIERRLQWLFVANKMRMSLPPKTRAIQEAFRQARI